MGALAQGFIGTGFFWSYTFQLILKSVGTQDYHWLFIFGFTLITILIQTLRLQLIITKILSIVAKVKLMFALFA